MQGKRTRELPFAAGSQLIKRESPAQKERPARDQISRFFDRGPEKLASFFLRRRCGGATAVAALRSQELSSAGYAWPSRHGISLRRARLRLACGGRATVQGAIPPLMQGARRVRRAAIPYS